MRPPLQEKPISCSGGRYFPAIYEHAYHFNYGFAIVKKNDKWGAIDTNGKVVIPFKYDGWAVSEGFCKSASGVIAASFWLDSKYCVIDCIGKIRVPWTSDSSACSRFFD